MGILVYRDAADGKELVGRIDYTYGANASFQYDPQYLDNALNEEELGISERLPLDPEPYDADSIEPFFSSLLPEGEVMINLARMYQVPQSDYLALLEQLGCESVGALTFISERINQKEYIPEYVSLDRWTAESLAASPIRATVQAVSAMRLSLPGAQAKVAWWLPESIEADAASLNDWQVPKGTAPSTHIIKIARKGEEDLFLNEMACSILAKACGIDTVEVSRVRDIPDAIAVKRYDRVWTGKKNERYVVRVHQEDFCQALGFPDHLKYQPDSAGQSYIRMIANLLEDVSESPIADKIDLAKRLLFNYVIGNTDVNLKKLSFLYNLRWTGLSLAPLYGATCVPLTGYSAKMAFDIGEHRYLETIHKGDLASIATDLDIPSSKLIEVASEVVGAFEAFDKTDFDTELASMLDRILNNAQPRLEVVKHFIDAPE